MLELMQLLLFILVIIGVYFTIYLIAYFTFKAIKKTNRKSVGSYKVINDTVIESNSKNSIPIKRLKKTTSKVTKIYYQDGKKIPKTKSVNIYYRDSAHKASEISRKQRLYELNEL